LSGKLLRPFSEEYRFPHHQRSGYAQKAIDTSTEQGKGTTMKEFSHEIDIHAPATRVWETLTDTNRFPTWNSFLHRINGSLSVGSHIEVKLELSPKKHQTIHAHVLTVEKNHELRSREQTNIPFLLDFEHILTIDSINPNRVRLTQRITFSGLFAILFAQQYSNELRNGMRMMNQALKSRVEQIKPSSMPIVLAQ
jgi:hypothetical protein